MRKKAFYKRLLGLSLTLVMSASLISGCGSGKQEDDSILKEATSGSKDYVFKSEEVNIEGMNPEQINSIKVVGDRVYAADYGVDGYMTVYSFNTDGSDVKTVKLAMADNEGFNFLDYDSEGNIYAVLGIYNWAYGDEDVVGPAETGGAIEKVSESSQADESANDASEADSNSEAGASKDSASENSASEDNASENGASEDEEMEGYAGSSYYDDEPDEEYFLVKYDQSGKQLLKVDLTENLPETDYFSAYSLVYSDKYGIIISSNRGVESYAEGSGFKKLLDIDESKSQYYNLRLFKGFSGDFFVSAYTDTGYMVAAFDPEKGEIGEESSAFQGTTYYSLFNGNGYDVYASSETAIFGYDYKTDKLVKLLDYVDSDLSVDYIISSIAAVSDSEFLAMLPDYEYNYRFTRLTKVPADQVKDKKIITLGGAYIDYRVRQAAVKFNQNNDEYKVKLVDYSTYNTEDDWEAGTNRFNLDIVSGNIPDIMSFDGEDPVDSYINKGLFLDLDSFIKNDEELSGVEYVDNVIDTFKTGDKMYQLVPSFNISTVAAKTSIVKGMDSITIKDCEEMIEARGLSYDEVFGITTRSDMLTLGIAFSGTKFIDWENKKCSFDSDGFIELLEFTKKFPEEYKEELWEKDMDAAYRNDEALFSVQSLYGFDNYRRVRYGLFGEDVTFIGFPNESGNNYSVIYPSLRLAASAQTKNSDGVWAFLRSFLTEEYQDSLDYDFPVRKSSFDKLAKKATEKEYYTNDDGTKEEVEEYYYIGDREVKLPVLSVQDVKDVEDFVKSVDEPITYNVNVNNIITEEASAFYSGQKTAKEVADIIQSRLTIYVNENS